MWTVVNKTDKLSRDVTIVLNDLNYRNVKLWRSCRSQEPEESWVWSPSGLLTNSVVTSLGADGRAGRGIYDMDCPLYRTSE
jgi:hypothetical protein